MASGTSGTFLDKRKGRSNFQKKDEEQGGGGEGG